MTHKNNDIKSNGKRDQQLVYIVDDDEAVRDALGLYLYSKNIAYKSYASCIDFLNDYDGHQTGCLVLDVQLPKMTGPELQKKLHALAANLPIIFITGHGDIPMAVEAMRQGAIDFLRKPIDENVLINRIQEIFERTSQESAEQKLEQEHLESYQQLTNREVEVYHQVVSGKTNKAIAAELKISERTVEVHRSNVMKKFSAESFASLVKINAFLASKLTSVS